MSLILDGTNGLSDVDGTAASPAIRGTDTNTGIFFPAADTIAFSEGGTEAMRINSSGDLLVGTTLAGSAGINLADTKNLGWLQSTGESVPNVFRQTSSAATVIANGYRYSATANGFASSYSLSWAKTAIALQAGTIRFYTNTVATVAAGTDVTPTERMRVESNGDVLIGCTVTPSALVKGTRLSSDYANNANTLSAGNTTASVALVAFFNGNGVVGSIGVVGSGTVYSTTSDYRLKEAVMPMTGALATVAALKPVTYNWKADGSAGQGFIAHELQAVVPDCVTGEKDAVDAEGNPQYQGIDTSYLVATLTAAIQELKSELDSVKAELATLKGAV
jgi:hypothetical protein